MPDLIQVANDLKEMPDGWLAQQMQQPSGSVPPWLVASEVARRQQLRSGTAKAQAPTSSVSQDLIRSLYAKIPPTAGLMPQTAGGPKGTPPVNLTPDNPGTLGAPPGTPPGNFKTPARTMAYGGSVDEEEDDSDNEPDNDSDHSSDSGTDGDSGNGGDSNFYPSYRLPAVARSQQMEQLYPPIPMRTPDQPATQPQTAPATNATTAPAAPPAAGVTAPYPGLEPVQPFQATYKNAKGEDVPFTDKFGRPIQYNPPPTPPTEEAAPYLQKMTADQKLLDTPISDFMDKEHTDKIHQYMTGIFGEAPSNDAIKSEMDYLKSQQLTKRQTIGSALMQFGTALMASKEHHFGTAFGQAGQATIPFMQAQKDKAMRLEMARLQLAAQAADRTEQFKQKIGADVVKGAQTLQQRELAQRAAWLREYQQNQTQAQRIIAGYQKQKDEYPIKQQKILHDAVNAHLTRDEATVQLNSPDPVVAAAARAALDSFQAADQSKARTQADVRTQTFNTEEATRLKNQKTMADYRQNLKTNAPGAPKKLTNQDVDSLAEQMIQGQLQQMEFDGKGNLLNVYQQNGQTVKTPATDRRTGNPINTPDLIHAEAKDRASNNLMNLEYYRQDPNFADVRNRELVAGRIARKSLSQNQRLGFYAGRGQNKQPQPPAQTQPAAAPPQQAQPPAAQPQQQAPPVPPSAAAIPEGKRAVMKNGDIWAMRNGVPTYLGRQQ